MWNMSTTTVMPEDPDRVITATVSALAASIGLTMTQLAADINMTRSTLQRRKAEGGWTAAEVSRAALRLGVTVSDLYTGLDGHLRIKNSTQSTPPITGRKWHQPYTVRDLPNLLLVHTPKERAA